MLEYLDSVLDIDNLNKLKNILLQKNKLMEENYNYSFWKEAIDQFPIINNIYKNYSQSYITINTNDTLTLSQKENILKSLQAFIPWRKGPFSIFGLNIDAEWQSNLKWDRVFPILDNLENKTICDLGCGNGYYMYRMAHYNPKLILGMDPTYKYKMNFDLLNKITNEQNIKFELFGYDELEFFPNTFDIILCMGVIYHHKDPIRILELCKHALKKGGQLIIESIALDTPDSTFLIPEKKYARMKNVWFIPTQKALQILCQRLDFKDISCHYNEIMSIDEQRKTEWANVDSFENFLDQKDFSKTEEGYPRPNRILFSVRKK